MVKLISGDGTKNKPDHPLDFSCKYFPGFHSTSRLTGQESVLPALITLEQGTRYAPLVPKPKLYPLATQLFVISGVPTEMMQKPPLEHLSVILLPQDARVELAGILVTCQTLSV